MTDWDAVASGGSSSSRRSSRTDWGAVASQPAARTRPRGKKRGRSVLGALENLGGDAVETVVGLGPGLLKTGRDIAYDIKDRPSRLLTLPSAPLTWGTDSRVYRNEVKPIAESYKYTYEPLAEGNLGEFGSRLYEHPLGPILDVATLLSGGVGGATKAGLLAKAGRSLELRSPAVLAGQEGRTISKAVTGSELSRRLRLGADAALKRLPEDFRVLGETARYGRALKVKEIKGKIGKELAAGRYTQAYSKLNKREAIAVNILHDFPTRSLLDSEIARLSKVKGAGKQVAVLSDSKIAKLIDEPTPKMRRALEESATLGQKQLDMLLAGKVKRSKGKKAYDAPVFSQESADLRRFQPSLIARGAKKDKKGNWIAPEGQTIEGMVDQIRQEIQAEGRWEPIYRPQKSVETTKGTRAGAGGSGAQNSPIKNNRAILQTMGRVAYDIDTLTPDYLRKVKWSIYSDRHQDLVDSALKAHPDHAAALVSSGKYEYVKRSRAEKIGYTERTGAEFEQRLQELIPDAEGEGIGSLSDELTTNVAEDAVTDAKGNRLVVPVALRKQVVGEFQRSNNALLKIYNQATAVWRALVLNTNPAWLTHNLVGNTFLYGIQNAGPAGLKAYLQAIYDTRGGEAVRKLLTDREIRNRLTPDDIVDIMPEQAAGTFFGTQNPKLTRGKLGKAIGVITAPTRPLRAVDISYEQALRRAMINKLVKQSPEFKAVWKKIPRETREFRAEARKILSDNPELNARVSKKVNDTLGNYLGLSEFEQGFLRTTMPFYAWFRAISEITLKLTVDTPGRADLLTKVGQVGWGDSVAQLGPDQVAYYLRSIFLTSKPGETPRGLQTQGFNPFMTEVQLGQALTSNKELLGLANPFLSGAVKTLGDTRSEGLAGLLGLPKRVGEDTIEGLPVTRLGKELRGKKPGEHATYRDQSEIEALLAFLGFPVKSVNTGNARANFTRYGN